MPGRFSKKQHLIRTATSVKVVSPYRSVNDRMFARLVGMVVPFLCKRVDQCPCAFVYRSYCYEDKH